MRIVTALLLTLCLAGCNHGSQNREAVRQGIVDHLQAGHFDMTKMDLNLTAVQFNGNHADAAVSVFIKGGSAADGMTMNYQLEQQGGKWVVTGRKDAGAPHGAGAMPGAANPHGGGMPAPGGAMPPAPGGAMMPAPADLPPAGQKK